MYFILHSSNIGNMSTFFFNDTESYSFSRLGITNEFSLYSNADINIKCIGDGCIFVLNQT